MVRVISVHNFPKQDVTTVDDITSTTVAPPNKLILAQKNHSILIKQFNVKDEILLPTVDQPVHVQHSVQGNYIATLEARGDVRFVRVYLGWTTASGTAPLRARIAGRVTPQAQQVQGVEMLEVPTPAMPDSIAVCPLSGNFVVGSKGKLSTFKYTVQVHETSRVEFVDFHKTHWDLEMGFTPTAIRLCEDLIAAHNDRYLVLLKVTSGLQENGSKQSKAEKAEKHPDLFDYNKLVEYTPSSSVNFRSVEFPSVTCEPQLRHTPFLTFREFAPKFKFDSLAKEEELSVEVLIQLQLAPCLVASGMRREVTDVFTCLSLKPYYSSTDDQLNRKQAVLCSRFYGRLRGVACFFGTQQEGYLHHYLPSTEKVSLVSVYPLTAPLMDAVLEDCLLHALTEAGLETYTMRAPLDASHHIDHADPICLLGLRPFLHVRQLVLGSQSLFLLASQESGAAWTVYQLALADSTTLWTDFLTAAEENQWEAPGIYSHLVREANLILRTRKESLQFGQNMTRSKAIMTTTAEETSVMVDNLYKQSCTTMGDYCMLHGSSEDASQYYRLSNLKLPEVVKRVQTLYQKVPANYKSEFDEASITRRLVFHVKEALRLEDLRYKLYRRNREEFYNSEIGNLVAVVLDILEKEDHDAIADVILASPVIQQFSSDRCLHILAGLTDPKPVESLALALMYLQRGQNERGLVLLASLDHLSLEPLLLRHYLVLIDQEDALSELALTLLKINPKFLAGILSSLSLEMNVMSFERILKMLTILLQNSGAQPKNAAEVLESFVEKHIKYWISQKAVHTASAKEAVNTLTWLYLTQLSQCKEIKGDEHILFEDDRPKYLDHLPPFGPDLNQILSPQHVLPSTENEPKNVLLKLQSLLASGIAQESLYRVRVLLCQTPKVYGSLSIQVQCAAPVEASQLLVNFAPQALLPYLKENNLDEASWRNLIEHIQNKISSAKDSKRKFYYERILNSVLEHISQTLSMESVADLLPPDYPNRNQYLRLAFNHEQAKQIRALIMMTGNQLL